MAFWNGFTGGDGPFMKQMVDAFNKENPNVTVAMNTLQWGDFYPKVPTAVASGAGPDVAIMHIDQLATNAARRVIVPLDEIATGLKLEEADFAPVVWNAGEYKDQRYGIPLDIHPLGFYVNKGLMTKAGITEIPTDRAGFEAAVTELKGKGGVANPFWVTATWPAHLIFTSLIAQFGGSIYDEEGAKATFNSDAGVEALEWMTSFIAKGDSPKNVSNDAQAVAFRQQRNALTFDGIWMMNEWAKVAGLEWEAAKFPTIGDKPAVWASSHNFVVTSQAAKDPNKLAASRAFISYISNKSLEWAKSGQVPARKSVRDSAEFKALKVQSVLAEQLPDVQFPPSVPGIGDVTTPTYETAVNEVVLGKKQAKAALDEGAKKADSLLKANQSKYQA
ncbi:ABC transporter substrate-binding protein [Knoellia aerolata]|uniref:ABC transporter substrate-binding protein n=1 Tax=Knoellia aerolata DSM 18566 TaxID=1385519 RepID=A0A0A0JWX3_9MICO|nr:ABC transporter substrate-binding protein [Knoellia aerolata]KGN41209.1 ABC transporter substrate-binding protein [Knoellia aerolata DSM 18566]